MTGRWDPERFTELPDPDVSAWRAVGLVVGFVGILIVVAAVVLAVTQ